MFQNTQEVILNCFKVQFSFTYGFLNAREEVQPQVIEYG